MDLSLSPDLAKFVDEKVQSGQFDSPEEVVREALVLLKAQDAVTADDVVELRKMLAPAIEQADRGDLAPLDMGEVKRKAEALRDGRRVS